jgi:hypothetical protein
MWIVSKPLEVPNKKIKYTLLEKKQIVSLVESFNLKQSRCQLDDDGFYLARNNRDGFSSPGGGFSAKVGGPVSQ